MRNDKDESDSRAALELIVNIEKRSNNSYCTTHSPTERLSDAKDDEERYYQKWFPQWTFCC